jgi:putative nucleotidyltransferase with HDIG domain
MEMTREKALADLAEFVDSDSLMKHSLAVEAAMIKMAKIFNEDENIWGCCGLLHDIAFQKYPESHGETGYDILSKKGYDTEFCKAVKAHCDLTNENRITNMAKSLSAVDQLASFIIACALVRPEKLVGLTPKSVKKKIKDKAFARAVNRDELQKGADELAIDMTILIDYLIDGIIERESCLNSTGVSLL